ncbi:hypothetical protein L3N51_02363 [Metallosphaera sp. J1]|nr:hypothetical protein [Metallosphaera javensis (ex Hofmann et al. 2022)]
MGQDGLSLGESVEIASLPVPTQIMCYLFLSITGVEHEHITFVRNRVE